MKGLSEKTPEGWVGLRMLWGDTGVGGVASQLWVQDLGRRQHSLPLHPGAPPVPCRDWKHKGVTEVHADEVWLTQAQPRGTQDSKPLAPSHRGMETADPPPRGGSALFRSLQKSGWHPCFSIFLTLDALYICIFSLTSSKSKQEQRGSCISYPLAGLHVWWKGQGTCLFLPP